MAEVKVKVNRTDGVSVEMAYDFGDNLDDALQRYGADVVFSQFVIGAKTAFRNKISALLNAQDKDELFKNSAEDVENAMSDWVPQVAGVRTSDGTAGAGKVSAFLNKLSDEDLAKFQADPKAFLAALLG